MFRGAMVAIVTPFKGGQVDEAALRDLIEFQVANGTHGIVPCGTTGESATLSFQEHERVVEITVEQVNKRLPVIAGTGSNKIGRAS
ncbi:MAG: 4-hydroxy-tetrahydrodipicolinate synthase, partial [Syntrophobacteraceae bacterium]|nr:4-hydroxy-tetrahydrodipicolinate synthase [Syntrophobacteraceae bacterium]